MLSMGKWSLLLSYPFLEALPSNARSFLPLNK
jgi:hypothetical protein